MQGSRYVPESRNTSTHLQLPPWVVMACCAWRCGAAQAAVACCPASSLTLVVAAQVLGVVQNMSYFECPNCQVDCGRPMLAAVLLPWSDF